MQTSFAKFRISLHIHQNNADDHEYNIAVQTDGHGRFFLNRSQYLMKVNRDEKLTLVLLLAHRIFQVSRKIRYLIYKIKVTWKQESVQIVYSTGNQKNSQNVLLAQGLSLNSKNLQAGLKVLKDRNRYDALCFDIPYVIPYVT